MNPIGKVTRIDGNKVHVTFKRTSACGSCHACFTLSPTEAEVELDNDLDAAVGNYVEIMMHPSNIVKASLIMYGVPLTGLIVGVCIGAFFNVYVSFGLGVALSLLSFGLIRLLEPKFSKIDNFKPRMLRIVSEQEIASRKDED